MRLVPQLVKVGRSAAAALSEQESWIHRRVESLTFPIADEPIYRRQVSIDFSIPRGLQSIDDEIPLSRAPRYYVPLSILSKWPPLHRLDLRGEDNRPIPFLTGRQNQILDAAVLVKIAEDVMPDDVSLTVGEMRLIAQIALARGQRAAEAFLDICPPQSELPDGTVSPGIEALRSHRAFVGLAQLLRMHTILWLRTEGQPEDREIVKFAYDMPWDGELRLFDRASFGLAPIVVAFETPHVGSTGSYHLNMTIPSPLRAVDSELVLYDASQEVNSKQALDPGQVKYIASPGNPVRTPYDDLEAFADVKSRQAKFYVAGERLGLAGRVYVAVRLEIDGFLRGASLGAVLIASVLGAFAFKPALVSKESSAAVAVLLVAPALLAYLLRPSEHVLSGGFLAGLRSVAISSGIWPLIAAALVVVVSNSTDLRWSLAGLAVVEFFTAIALVLPIVQTRREVKRRRKDNLQAS